MTQAYRTLIGTDKFAESYIYLNNMLESLRSWFSGAVPPPAAIPYQMWADTVSGDLKQANAAGDAFVRIGPLATPYFGALGREGGVMLGDLDMGGFTITNLGLGTVLAAARQQELDLKAPLAAPQFTGDARVNQDPAGGTSLVRKSWADGRYVLLSGGVLTGVLVLSGDAVIALQPVTLQQLKTFVDFSTTTGHRHTGTDSRKIRAADLDAGAAAAGTALMSNGAGASAFTALQQLPMRFQDDPALIVDISGAISGSYQTVDLAGITDTDTYAALLRVRGDFATSTPTLRIRRDGSSIDNANLDISPVISGGFAQTWTAFVPVELSSIRRFQWRAAPATTGTLKINLVGYMRKSF